MQDRISGHQARKPVKAQRNIKLRIAFSGSEYNGWQTQPGKPTVQGILTSAIEKIARECVKLNGSGRTDSGTHARELVCNFMTAAGLPDSAWVPALNRVLPEDIRVLSACRVPSGFHARHCAKSKIYRYQIYCGQVLPPNLASEHFHYPLPINLKIMVEAARFFVGEHDFASFAARSGRKKARDPGESGSGGDLETNTTRTIYRCTLTKRGRRLLFTVEGNGFLHHMVRNMVGTLLELGRSRITLEQFRDLLETRDRTQAGFTVPSRGLILVRVRY
jgi:tRNA pseudouridine38-40 synthase